MIYLNNKQGICYESLLKDKHTFGDRGDTWRTPSSPNCNKIGGKNERPDVFFGFFPLY